MWTPAQRNSHGPSTPSTAGEGAWEGAGPLNPGEGAAGRLSHPRLSRTLCAWFRSDQIGVPIKGGLLPTRSPSHGQRWLVGGFGSGVISAAAEGQAVQQLRRLHPERVQSSKRRC